jgi:hypothetical protein
MRDDLLKEELMSYARSAAEAASQPGAAAIHRRARRHYQRVAALTVAGAVAAVGLGVGLGLRRDQATPTVDQPSPPVTSPAPGVKPPATPAVPAPAGKPHPPTTGPVAARPPASFVTLVGPADFASGPSRVAVVSTSTGKVVRYLTGPAPAGTDLGRPALSPDRAWVYYSLTAATGTPGTARAGTYRVPFAGGPATKLTGTASGGLAVSPDGSKLLLESPVASPWRYGLAVLDLASGKERFMAFPFRQAGDIFGYAWSPDSRQVAVVRGPVLDSETFPVQLFLLDVASGRWRTAVSFDAGGPVPEPGQGELAWPAPRRVTFVARFAGSDTTPGTYRLVGVDPGTGRRTPGPVLSRDPNGTSRVAPGLLDLDASGRYLLYGTAWVRVSTWRLDTSGRGGPVRISQFNALDPEETHAYESGAW